MFGLGHVTLKMPISCLHRDLPGLLDTNLKFREEDWARDTNLGVVSG